MPNPFIQLIADIIHLYTLAVIIWAVLATLISFKIVNPHQPIVERVMYALNKLVEPALRPFHKFIPDLGGIDISPILLILLLNFLQGVLFRYFY